MTELTRSEKIRLGTTEIAKRIRTHLKDEFKDCKFSVTSEYYSGGSSLTVALMKADRKIKMDFNKIPESTLFKYSQRSYSPYSIEDLETLQNNNYHQLNQYTLKDKYSEHWCNGAFLTYQGFNLLKRVVQIADYYNYDDSDSMTDYYSVNFSFSLELGKWDKPFIDGIAFKTDQPLEDRINQRIEQVKINTIKAEEDRRLKQIEIDQYKKLDKPNVPSGVSHIIDASGFRALTVEEKETGYSKDQLKYRWFKDSVDWKKYTLEL